MDGEYAEFDCNALRKLHCTYGDSWPATTTSFRQGRCRSGPATSESGGGTREPREPAAWLLAEGRREAISTRAVSAAAGWISALLVAAAAAASIGLAPIAAAKGQEIVKMCTDPILVAPAVLAPHSRMGNSSNDPTIQESPASRLSRQSTGLDNSSDSGNRWNCVALQRWR